MEKIIDLIEFLNYNKQNKINKGGNDMRKNIKQLVYKQLYNLLFKKYEVIKTELKKYIGYFYNKQIINKDDIKIIYDKMNLLQYCGDFYDMPSYEQFETFMIS